MFQSNMQVDDHESVSLQRFARHCLAPTPPKQHDLAASIAELRQIADGHDEVLAEAAGITAGSWYAWPATHAGHELVAAGLLIMAGGHEGRPLDFEALERWTRVGFERGTRFRKGER